MAGRHQGDMKAFRELSFAEQAQSITATLNNLQAAIEHHIEQSPRRQETIDKCLAQVDRLRQHLLATYAQPSAQSASEGAANERFLAADQTGRSQDDWERHLLGAATDCGVSLPDSALSSEELYE